MHAQDTQVSQPQLPETQMVSFAQINTILNERLAHLISDFDGCKNEQTELKTQLLGLQENMQKLQLPELKLYEAKVKELIAAQIDLLRKQTDYAILEQAERQITCRKQQSEELEKSTTDKLAPLSKKLDNQVEQLAIVQNSIKDLSARVTNLSQNDPIRSQQNSIKDLSEIVTKLEKNDQIRSKQLSILKWIAGGALSASCISLFVTCWLLFKMHKA